MSQLSFLPIIVSRRFLILAQPPSPISSHSRESTKKLLHIQVYLSTPLSLPTFNTPPTDSPKVGIYPRPFLSYKLSTMTKVPSISAQNSAYQRRKKRCEKQLKDDKITFAEFQQRSRWQWYSSPEKMPSMAKEQKNLNGWVGKAKRNEKDVEGSKEQQKKATEDQIVDAAGFEDEDGDGQVEKEVVDTSLFPRWKAVNN